MSTTAADGARPTPVKGLCYLGRRTYCYQTEQWAVRGRAAIKWSMDHPSRADRAPVPYPARRTGPHQHYVVYLVRTGTGAIYKYGITRVDPWTSRANIGRRNCNNDKRFSACTREWVAVTQNTDGFFWARYLESSLIKRYERAVGACPPGQSKSCS